MRSIIRGSVVRTAVLAGVVVVGPCRIGQATAQPAPASTAASGTIPIPADERLEAEVILRDGRRVQGELVRQDAEAVVLLIAGLETLFKRDSIQGVKTLAPVEERYRTLRAAIGAEDADGMLQLARWLQARGRHQLASVEVERVLALEPGNPEALELRTWLEAQAKVEAVGPSTRADDAPDLDDPLRFPRSRRPFPLLTDEQVNVIRVFEIDLNNPPRMTIPRQSVTSLLTTYEGSAVEGRGSVPETPEGRAVFHRLRPAEILGWMFDLQARDLYGTVRVEENPEAMRRFRDDVHRGWLVNSCATTRCHGGEEAGRLFLFNKRQGSDAAVYTNFLILERYRLPDGRPLIDYAKPEDSPLLEMGLPRDAVARPHPEVEGPNRPHLRPVFDSKDDQKYKRAVAWIASMYPRRTDYPITYEAPVPAAAGLLPPPGSGDMPRAPAPR